MSASGANTAERGPTHTRASPLRSRRPLVVALSDAERRVQHRHHVAEARLESATATWGVSAISGTSTIAERPAASVACHRAQVDLGLARAGHAVEQDSPPGRAVAVRRPGAVPRRSGRAARVRARAAAAPARGAGRPSAAAPPPARAHRMTGRAPAQDAQVEPDQAPGLAAGAGWLGPELGGDRRPRARQGLSSSRWRLGEARGRRPRSAPPRPPASARRPGPAWPGRPRLRPAPA